MRCILSKMCGDVCRSAGGDINGWDLRISTVRWGNRALGLLVCCLTLSRQPYTKLVPIILRFRLETRNFAGDWLHQFPVPIYNCPSRRGPGPFTVQCASCGSPIGIDGKVVSVSCSDYAANVGDGDPDLSQLNSWPNTFWGPADLVQARFLTRDRRWPQPPRDWTGVSYLRVGVKFGEITDGLSNTLLVGEKYVNRLAYSSGEDWGDNESMFSGFNNDNHRSTNPFWPYMRDKSSVLSIGSFGSAHNSGNFLLCDGSVHSVSYGIGKSVFRYLGNRHDGQSVTIE